VASAIFTKTGIFESGGLRFGRAAFAAIAQDRAAQRMLHMSAATMKYAMIAIHPIQPADSLTSDPAVRSIAVLLRLLT